MKPEVRFPTGLMRKDVHLGNWRETPYSAWSFQNVNELVPSAVIHGTGGNEGAPGGADHFAHLMVEAPGQGRCELGQFLQQTHTDSMIVMRRGEIIFEWYSPTTDAAKPHIIYSISKSLTGLLAGILVGQGAIDPDDRVTRYLPEAAGSAYGDASLRNLLDMQISLDFNEDYLDKTGKFDAYRRATGWNPQVPGSQPQGLGGFLCSLGKGPVGHGEVHAYRSPNTDMCGMVLERAGGARLHELLQELLWKPMGAHSDAFVTVDREGVARAAGGISVTARDMARVGELVRLDGAGVVPADWIRDLWKGGNRAIWSEGDQAAHFPGGSYRSYWYETGKGELAAIGIHGQWIWVDPQSETVIAKQSCQPEPTNDPLDQAITAMLRAVSRSE
ncbi:MAG: serine hydrolase [Rhizobiaceae bacterium]